MVDALASDRSDQSFGEAVLPRRAWGDGLVTDAHGAQSVRDGSAINAIPITDQVARRLSPRECFGDLACDPVRGRIVGQRCAILAPSSADRKHHVTGNPRRAASPLHASLSFRYTQAAGLEPASL